MSTDEALRAPERHPTLADVAGAAGVSTSTASRALRGSDLVSESTRARVVDAAARLGFEPNRLARSLRTRSSLFVGAVVPDVATVFYARALKSAQDVLERAGYQMLATDSERDAAHEAANLRTLLSHRVDGILVATSGGFTRPATTPVVFFDQIVPGAGAGCVAVANRDGIALLVEHLLGHGHERIGYIGAPPGLTSATERLEAFHEAIAAAGLRAAPEYVALGDEEWSEAGGERATDRLFALDARPTALVAAGDTLAAGALRAIRRAGLRVPEDVALVSFDDPVFGDLLDPPITALSRHDTDLGERAAALLLEALADNVPRAGAEVRVPLELIVRRSCGCAG